MNLPDVDALINQRLRIMRILIASLVAGLLFFTAIVIYLRATGQMAGRPAVPILTYVGFTFAVMMLGLHTYLSDQVAAVGRKKIGQETPPEGEKGANLVELAGPWYGLYQNRMIVGGALLEGPAFFLLIAYLIEGNLWSLVGAALLIGGLITKFPSRAGVEQWVQEQRVLLHHERLGT